jgi:triosephosphate isomerase
MKIIVANWKMNPSSAEEARRIVSEIRAKIKGLASLRLVICPPFVYLNEVGDLIKSKKEISLGAQDVFIGEGVSHTGEISPEMLKKAGVKYVIIGHSEKRAAGDSDEIVREKLIGVLKAGFKAILCIGEKEHNKEGEHFGEIERQLKSALEKLPKKFIKNIIIAYEPVWAIGKSERDAMQPAELHGMAIFIRRVLSDIFKTKEIEKFVILYGGSVTHENAKDIVEKGNVSGLLIGRESLKADDFVELMKKLG